MFIRPKQSMFASGFCLIVTKGSMPIIRGTNFFFYVWYTSAMCSILQQFESVETVGNIQLYDVQFSHHEYAATPLLSCLQHIPKASQILVATHLFMFKQLPVQILRNYLLLDVTQNCSRSLNKICSQNFNLLDGHSGSW